MLFITYHIPFKITTGYQKSLYKTKIINISS
nr:MAG TPA: hypothetical protein [Caudoviricetes sp.]